MLCCDFTKKGKYHQCRKEKNCNCKGVFKGKRMESSCTINTRRDSRSVVYQELITEVVFCILVISTTVGVVETVNCPSGDTAGIIKDGKTCLELIPSANYECYNATIESDCCSSCNSVTRTNTGCLYGDRQAVCNAFACSSLVNISDCCETCATTTTSSSTSSPVISTASSSASSTTSTARTTSAPTSPTGAIVGGVVGGVAGLSLITAGVIIAVKLKKSKKNQVHSSDTTVKDNIPKMPPGLINGTGVKSNMLDSKAHQDNASFVVKMESVDKHATKNRTNARTESDVRDRVSNPLDGTHDVTNVNPEDMSSQLLNTEKISYSQGNSTLYSTLPPIGTGLKTLLDESPDGILNNETDSTEEKLHKDINTFATPRVDDADGYLNADVIEKTIRVAENKTHGHINTVQNSKTEEASTTQSGIYEECNGVISANPNETVSKTSDARKTDDSIVQSNNDHNNFDDGAVSGDRQMTSLGKELTVSEIKFKY